MDNYNVVNILDMIESLGEKRVVDVLQQFSCAKNLEIEKFVKNNLTIYNRVVDQRL